MKKILYMLFGPQTIFTLFTIAIVMVLATTIELRIFKIPYKYADGVWLSNIILTFIIYLVSVWLNKTD